MARLKKADHEAAIIEIIKRENIKFVVDIFAYYGRIVRSDFYNLKLHESKEIQDLLEKNKIISRNRQMKRWEESDNPVLQIALFRLTCTDEQRKMISTNYNESQTTLLDKDGNNYTPTINVVLQDGEIK